MEGGEKSPGTLFQWCLNGVEEVEGKSGSFKKEIVKSEGLG